MLCSASKDSDALLRLEGLVAYCVGFASMIIAYCVGFASIIMIVWVAARSVVYRSRVTGAGVLLPRRRRVGSIVPPPTLRLRASA